MKEADKITFYHKHRDIIHSTIKLEVQTKSLWRKLYWSTPKESDQYKVGCVDILKIHFLELYNSLN